MGINEKEETNSAKVEVIPATEEDAPILANLLELYAHDFSAFHEIEIGEDGRFGYTPLPLYWRESWRHPFLVRVDGRLGGFVLVKRGSDITQDSQVWDMAEFFVLRTFRKRGIGRQAAHEVWRRFPGKWEVRVMQANIPATHFWYRAISDFTGEKIPAVSHEKNGSGWWLFSFESR